MALEDGAPTGSGRAGRVDGAAAGAVTLDAAVELCLRAADDDASRRTHAICSSGSPTTDCFSLTDTTEDGERLAARALEVARRTNVSVPRTAACWAPRGRWLPATPIAPMALAQEAMREMPHLPIFSDRRCPGTRRGSSTRIDRRCAAAELLDRLDGVKAPSTYVDLIPAFYATELLHRLGRPIAGHGVGDARGVADRAVPDMMRTSTSRPARRGAVRARCRSTRWSTMLATRPQSP